MNEYNSFISELMQLVRQGKNPQQYIINFLENKIGSTPLGENLLNLARSKNEEEIEKIARNLCAQRGVDFDTEFNAFKQQLGFK